VQYYIGLRRITGRGGKNPEVSEAGAMRRHRESLKTVASEENLRVAGAQEPEFTSRK
jgi:hypothetical protein